MGKGYRMMLTGTALMLAFSQCTAGCLRAEEVDTYAGLEEELQDEASEECMEIAMESMNEEAAEPAVGEAKDASEVMDEEAAEPAVEEAEEASEVMDEEAAEPAVEEAEEASEVMEEEMSEFAAEEPVEPASEMQEDMRIPISVTELRIGDANGEKIYDGSDKVEAEWHLADEEGNELPDELVEVFPYLENREAGLQQVVCYLEVAEGWKEEYVLAEDKILCELCIKPAPLKLTVPDASFTAGADTTEDNLCFTQSMCVEGFAENAAGTSIIPDDFELPGVTADWDRLVKAVEEYKDAGSYILDDILKPMEDENGQITGQAGNNYYFDPEQTVPGDLTLIVQPAQPEEETRNSPVQEETKTSAGQEEETGNSPAQEEASYPAPEANVPETKPENEGPENTETENTETENTEPSESWVPVTEAEKDIENTETETSADPAAETEKTEEPDVHEAETETEEAADVSIRIEGIRDGASVRDKVEMSFACTGQDYLPGSCQFLVEGPGGVKLPSPETVREKTDGIEAALASVEADGAYTLHIRAQNRDGKMFEEAVHFKINKAGSSFELDEKTAHRLQVYTHTEPFEVTVIEKNPDPVETAAVMVRHGGETGLLESSSDFERTQGMTEDGRYEYTYVLPAKLFEEAGTYEVSLITRDKAGNVSASEEYGCRIVFEIAAGIRAAEENIPADAGDGSLKQTKQSSGDDPKGTETLENGFAAGSSSNAGPELIFVLCLTAAAALMRALTQSALRLSGHI